MYDIEKTLENYRLTTAEILYALPDYPQLLQTFLWQELDLPPRFPRLYEFLVFWEKSIEGKLFSVKIAYAGHLVPQTVHIPSFMTTWH